MISGKKKVKINREYIFSKISPYDIFKYYYPYDFELNKHCPNCFVGNDSNPSMIIGSKSDTGEIIFKCFNSSNRGDCFSFVMQLHGDSYTEAVLRIAKDFGLVAGSVVDHRKIISSYEQPASILKPTIIQAKTKKITQREIDYLAKNHLTIADLNFCKDTKVYSIGEWAKNRMRQGMGKDEICFGYNLVNERGSWIKIYRPERGKKDKWRSSIPFSEMHGVGNINNCEVGVVVKSLKDGAFVNKYILPNVEIVQAEDFAAFSDENIIRLKQSCKRLFISFDNDTKGVEACTEISNEIGCEYINPPKDLLSIGVTDWTDWGKKTDVQTVVDFWKFKNVIE